MTLPNWSTNASLNVVSGGVSGSGGVNINEGMVPSNVNDAMRDIMAQIKAGVLPITQYVAKAPGTYTAVSADNNQLWDCSGAVTINLTAAATLGSGWALWVRAAGGFVNIDPNGAETIDGIAMRQIPQGCTARILCTGTQFVFHISALAPFSTNVVTGFLTGLTLSNNAGDATNDIDIAVGATRDSTDAETLVSASALGKRLDAAWTVGGTPASALGGLDTGAVGNSTYYVWLIRRPDTGVVDALFSLSATAPTMPTNYTQKARIGSFAREAAANSMPCSYSRAITEWVAYTPTFTGFGTATFINFLSRAVGDSLEIQGRFLTGTTTAVEARATYGFNGVDNNIYADTTKLPGATQVIGNAITDSSSATFFGLYPIGEPTQKYSTFGTQGSAANPFTKVNGTAIGSSRVVSYFARIPVLGWTLKP